MGWFWYLGMLVPVIGLVTIGDQSMADRYTYLPSIGIFLALVWAAGDLAEVGGRRSEVGGRRSEVGGRTSSFIPHPSSFLLAAVLLAFCGLRSFDQLQYWRDAKSLLGHAVSLAEKQPVPDALAILQRAVATDPHDLEARKLLAFAWLKTGHVRDGIGEFREMLRQDPNEPVALNSLAWILATHPDAAIRNGPEAVKLAEKVVAQQEGDQPKLLDTLAAAYAETGQFREAVRTAEKAQAAAAGSGNKDLTNGIAERVKLYKEGKPYRDPNLESRKPGKP